MSYRFVLRYLVLASLVLSFGSVSAVSAGTAVDPHAFTLLDLGDDDDDGIPNYLDPDDDNDGVQDRDSESVPGGSNPPSSGGGPTGNSNNQHPLVTGLPETGTGGNMTVSPAFSLTLIGVLGVALLAATLRTTSRMR